MASPPLMPKALGAEAHMRYGITILALGSWPFIEISAEEFEQAKRAKEKLITFLGIEEKLDILLENYVEYEKHLIDLTLRQVVFSDLLLSSGMTDKQHLTRRLANLLSAARLYADQAKHDLSAIYERNSAQQELLRQALSREYDNRFGYRVMEALRNYMQHRSLPVKKLSYSSKWEEVDSEQMLRCSAEVYLDVIDLREDSKFKSNVLSELEKRGKEVEITPLVRQYIEGIGCAHEELRSNTKQDIDAWARTVSDLIDRVRDPLNGDLTGLGIVAEDERRYVETVHISEEPKERLDYLARKNSSFTKLSYRYASGYHGRELNDDEAPNTVGEADV